MAFLKGFEHDIFISYAHVDNQKLPGQDNGWVDYFHDLFEALLIQRFGRFGRINIWRDKDLTGNKIFNQTIEKKLDGSAFVIALYSAGHQESDYCTKELEYFFQKTIKEKYGAQFGDNNRIINVLLNDISADSWHESLRGSAGFDFFDPENTHWPISISSNSSYLQSQTRQLVDAMYECFKSVEKDRSSSDIKNQGQEDKSISDKNDIKIFIGSVSDSLKTTRKKIIKQLNQSGVEVVGNIPPPFKLNEHNETLEEQIKGCSLALHMYDELSGLELPEDPDKSFPQLQNELVAEKNVKQMVWIPDDLNIDTIEDDLYRNFINELENKERKDSEYEFIRSSATDLGQQISSQVERYKTARILEKEKDEKLSILLDTHMRDQQEAFEIGNFLMGKNIFPYVNPGEDNPRDNIEILENRLKKVNYFILVFGQVAREWVSERLALAFRTIVSHEYPVEKCAVFVAPPNKNQADINFLQRFYKVDFLYDMDGILKLFKTV